LNIKRAPEFELAGINAETACSTCEFAAREDWCKTRASSQILAGHSKYTADSREVPETGAAHPVDMRLRIIGTSQ